MGFAPSYVISRKLYMSHEQWKRTAEIDYMNANC